MKIDRIYRNPYMLVNLHGISIRYIENYCSHLKIKMFEGSYQQEYPFYQKLNNIMKIIGSHYNPLCSQIYIVSRSIRRKLL